MDVVRGCDPEQKTDCRYLRTGVLSRVFGPKSEKETGDRRSVHKIFVRCTLHILSTYVLYVARMGKMRLFT